MHLIPMLIVHFFGVLSGFGNVKRIYLFELLLPCLSIALLYLIDIDEESVLQLCLDFITERIAHAFKYLVCLDGFGIVGAVGEIEIFESYFVELRLIVDVIGDATEPVLTGGSVLKA